MRAGADVAQLVEHHLAKVGVAGSNPVVRSKKTTPSPAISAQRIGSRLMELTPTLSPFDLIP
jgi:hypothetical protein